MKRFCTWIIFPLLILYMIYKAHQDKINDQTIVDANIPTEFDGCCLFFISDIHRRRIRKKTLQGIKKQVDVVIIGGDLTEKYVPLRRTRQNIKKLNKWNAPICFVWGNNDEEVNRHSFEALLKEEGVNVLADDSLYINRGSKVLQFIGLNYPPSYKERRHLVLNSKPGDYSILLTHVPILYSELCKEERERIHIMLAGHTHGGQIRIADLAQFDRGSLTKHGSTSFLISEGYGYSVLPFRLGTDAECHVITLHRV